MHSKKASWRSSLKEKLTGLSLIGLAFVFIAVGTIVLLLPSLLSAVWQPVGGALLGTGLTILVTTITARQASLEQYKKEANLQRKTDVYGPLHAELKELREIFDKVHAGVEPYPRWIEISGVNRPSSLRFAHDSMFPKLYYWPIFKADYRIDNFSLEAQTLLNEVQNRAVVYNEAVEAAREFMQRRLRPHIAASVTKEGKSLAYQAWLRKRTSNPSEYNRWFEFVFNLQTGVSPSTPLGEGLSRDWSAKIRWLLADKPDQAALEIFNGQAMHWDAAQHSSLSWFQDIFDATASELKNHKSYQEAQTAQRELFTKLLEAEKMLSQGLRIIRDRYEGGAPLV